MRKSDPDDKYGLRLCMYRTRDDEPWQWAWFHEWQRTETGSYYGLLEGADGIMFEIRMSMIRFANTPAFPKHKPSLAKHTPDVDEEPHFDGDEMAVYNLIKSTDSLVDVLTLIKNEFHRTARQCLADSTQSSSDYLSGMSSGCSYAATFIEGRIREVR